MNYRDNCYRFRQDSSFLYFFGLSEPDLAAGIDLSTGDAVVFADDVSLDDIVWTGPLRPIADRAPEVGVSRTASRSAIASFVSASGPGSVAYLPPYRSETTAELSELLGVPYRSVEQGASLELIRAVVALREIKEEGELEEMAAAAETSVAMHRAALAMAEPGMADTEIVAELTRIAQASGGGLSFPVIATIDGSVLHSRVSGNRLAAGGLFLVDAGAETASGYAGDLTTTFPVSPSFTSRQADIYRIVLDSHRAACSAIRPGVPFREAHFAAARAIVSGLKGLGLMKGDVDEAVAAGAHALFFPHGIGHQVGLDVHDMESLGEVNVGYDGESKSTQFGLKSLRMAKPLRPGMAVTVEPGIYFISELIDRWRAEGKFAQFIDYDAVAPYRGFGGIRNEEDWAVTETGGRRIGPEFDKSISAVEALRSGPRTRG